MSRILRSGCAALASAALLGLSGCGGGGGSDESGSTPVAARPAAVTLSGTVATGAAFEGATLVVTDRSGAEVGRIDAVGADGSYTLTLAAGAQAPFVLTATRDELRLVSVHDSASDATVNVTPVTTLIAARLSPSGDPARLVDEVAGGSARIDAAALASRVEEVRSLLQPVLDATGNRDTDLLRGALQTDGRGHDRLLDSLKITITPDSSGSSNIQVTVRQQTAEDSEPASISFNSASTAAPPALPAVSATDLVPDGSSALIADLLARATACYALPLESRVSRTDAAAGPADVQAAACRDLFFDADPAGYLHNGARVGPSGAFGGLFRAGATGVVFSRGSYEFSRVNGDLVIGYTTTTTGGSTDTGALVVRRVNEAGSGRPVLRVIGNQYAHDGGVAAFHQHRRFLSLAQSGWDYHSVGYTLSVANRTDVSGNPVYDRVVVTSPRGHQLTLRPTSGSSYLVLVKSGGTPTGTNFVRLRSRYAAADASGHPSERDTSLFFAPNDMEDTELSGLSAHSVWKFEYYLASAPGTLAATQHYKTRARPLSIAELRQRGMATLTEAGQSALAAAALPSNGRLPLPDSGGVTLDWQVPAGALAPTHLKLFGRASASGGSFNDQQNVASTARSGTIGCSAQTASDAHCTNGGDFVPAATADGLHLWARDGDGREFASFYAMYRLATPQ